VANLQVSHTAAVWLAYVDTGHTATYLFIGVKHIATPELLQQYVREKPIISTARTERNSIISTAQTDAKSIISTGVVSLFTPPKPHVSNRSR